MTNWRTVELAKMRPSGPVRVAKKPMMREPVIFTNKVPQGKSLRQHARGKPSAPVTCHAAKRAADGDPKINWHRKSVLLEQLKGRSRSERALSLCHEHRTR